MTSTEDTAGKIRDALAMSPSTTSCTMHKETRQMSLSRDNVGGGKDFYESNQHLLPFYQDKAKTAREDATPVGDKEPRQMSLTRDNGGGGKDLSNQHLLPFYAIFQICNYIFFLN